MYDVMPNLSQIYSLRQSFHTLNSNDVLVKSFLEKTETRIFLEKAFREGRINEQLGEPKGFLLENLNPETPELIKYFEEGNEEDVALLFIDITSFSKRISGFPNGKIKSYLDDYYRQIIPIIYENDGEIEKLMGDGIICVFGKPFFKSMIPYNYVYKAEDCAEAVIKKFYGTDKSVKVAIHKGTINYYKVPGEHYGEYTIIGQPMTDLYRLESVSRPNAINFFTESLYDKLGWIYSQFDNTIVYCDSFDIAPLQGVGFKQVKYMMFPDYK